MENQDERLKEEVRRQFAKNADKYVASATHAQGEDLALMLEWLQPQADWAALDIATGGGHAAKALSPRVFQVVATDLTRGMLETTRRFLSPHCNNVSYVVADAERLPFLDDTFDVVTCRIAAHHFPDPRQFVREAARVVKVGDRLLLIDNVVPEDDRVAEFVNRLEKLRDPSHARCCRIGEWLRWADEAGLAAVNSRLRKKTFEFPSWVRRTADSEEQVERVERHLLQADADLKQYCGLTMKGTNIASIHIDEWMALFGKKAT